MDKVCTSLKLRPHKIKVENGEEITIYSSVECKGIIGNDGRNYVLDLLRIFPPDLNYIQSRFTYKKTFYIWNLFFLLADENEKKTIDSKKFRHKLCSLRQELIEAFIE